MIVPQYWAEARVQHKGRRRQITVRRFGWSDASQTEAQAHAEQRAWQALEDVRDGEPLARREPRVPYNGAEGVPIREEVVERHGASVITRNAYGARCLNTPDVLFVDIDFQQGPSQRFAQGLFAAIALPALLLGWLLQSATLLAALLCLALFVASVLPERLHGLFLAFHGGAGALARRRVGRFLAAHPEWNLRLYRTPAGMRVLATQRTFASDDPAVAACFAALGADPLYARMCLRQRCFRARLSAKPWRIGIAGRRGLGHWPVAAERLPLRRHWVERYEARAQDYAACRFVESLGSGVIDPAVAAVLRLHDELSGAGSQRPLA